MFEVRKLELKHLAALAEETENKHVLDWVNSGYAAKLQEESDSFAGFVGEELMVAAGLMPLWKGRAHLWSVFSPRAKNKFISVFRGIRKFLEDSPYRRVEMDVPLDRSYTDTAIKRAILWGFTLECSRAKYYRPGGGDSALFSWTKEL